MQLQFQHKHIQLQLEQAVLLNLVIHNQEIMVLIQFFQQLQQLAVVVAVQDQVLVHLVVQVVELELVKDHQMQEEVETLLQQLQHKDKMVEQDLLQ